MKGFSIKEISIISLNKYKKNWKVLLLISTINVLISMLIGIISISINTVENSMLKLLTIILIVILILVTLYFNARLTVSMIISAKESLLNEGVSYYYNRAKSLTWKYIKFSILFILIGIIPGIFLLMASRFGDDINRTLLLRILVILIGYLPIIYLNTIFRFSLFTAVIYPNENKVFKYSKNLVKGNTFNVFILSIISFALAIIGRLTDIIFVLDQYGELAQIGILVIRSIPAILITPFIVLLNIEALSRLESLKKIKKSKKLTS